ncbi:MAG TPA: KpsF/GutQ family sugar-phosphate isomerase [Lacipirellulaceae bacterium]|nr:KpsF/GutQ family sugar-phosphate isomerase [Lacipirellulaceae bacterium]
MSKEAPKRRSTPKKLGTLSAEEQLRAGREIVRREAAGVWKVSYRLNSSFCEAVKLLYTCKGSVIVTGMGKAGIIGQKIAATLSSTGTRAHFMHPAEAFHGDLGRVHPDGVVVMLSQSGETAEVVQLLPSLREFGVPLIAITAARTSSVGQAANVVIELGELEEVCSLGLAPSTSTTAMLAVGDALALVLSKMRNFQADDFARFHPGGALGRKLSRVDDIMRPISECRVASEAQTVRQVIVACGKPGRRSGAIMLTDKTGRLTGLFTDSDLARLFERRDEQALDRPMSCVMVARPTTVPSGTRVGDAVMLLAQRKFSELPVVDKKGRPIGLVDVTDVVGLKAEAEVANVKPADAKPKKVA